MERESPEIHASPERPAHRAVPSKLHVEVTTRCNLHCAMCAKEARGQRIDEGHMSRETFERLRPAFAGLEALVLNGIGEPLLHPDLERFIEAARRDLPSHAWVGFQTNAQLLGPARARSLARAGVDRVCMSADAVTPELFGAIRRGGRQEAVEAAAAELHRAGRERGRPIALGVEFVAQADNVGQLPELVRWAARHRLDFAIVSHLLPYGRETSAAAAFDTSTDRAMRHFRAWREQAAAEGIDLGRYFQLFLKIHPTPEERRLVERVQEMVAAAAAQGLALNLGRLLRAADDPLAGRVADAFGEAQEIAAREGIDLRLPRPRPTQERSCEFVERGSAFVSWDGGVHPCYFLWHRCTSWVGGLAKHVEPAPFGSLADQELLAIWNGGRARSFREGVLRYDFPFCYDCNHALCDNVQEGEFVQDCHLNNVPCAACLWCTGVFQCL
ncbi:MAG: radical SAM/SPASM family putative metalloenzyme maturase [Deltaproteobacteria bacterium]|nr:radical SAM/SPASM family putative metalloenzyme maturase [Deltaproteobacteria bacterium]